jgi:outer membrane protein
MNRLASIALAVALAAALSGSPSAAETKKLGFKDVVAAAASDSPDIAIAAEGVKSTGSRVESAKALRLPRLHVDANAMYWDKELSIAFAPGVPGAVVRDQLTTGVTVVLVQPLSGLLVIDKMIGLEQDGQAAASFELDATKLDAATRAAEAYLRLLQAQALRDVAHKSVAQLDAQLERARALQKAGTFGDADVLRIEAARDSVKQGLVKAEAGVETAERGLALSLGLPDGTRLSVTDDLPQSLPPIPWTQDEAVAAARAQRPELKAASKHVEQAEGGRKIAWSNYLPNINAIGEYQYTGGQKFQPENAYFVGVTLSWDLWDWGHTGATVDEAAHKKRQAQLAADTIDQKVAFDARRRWLEAKSSRDALELAQSALKSAEEAYRIESVRSQQGAATATDVLDAETEVARARANYAVSRYDYFIALVDLARAVGVLPDHIV